MTFQFPPVMSLLLAVFLFFPWKQTSRWLKKGLWQLYTSKTKTDSGTFTFGKRGSVRHIPRTCLMQILESIVHPWGVIMSKLHFMTQIGLGPTTKAVDVSEYLVGLQSPLCITQEYISMLFAQVHPTKPLQLRRRRVESSPSCVSPAKLLFHL